MKKKAFTLLALVVLVALFLSWRHLNDSSKSPVAPVDTGAMETTSPVTDKQVAEKPLQAREELEEKSEPRSSLLDQYDFSDQDFEVREDVAASMAQAREEGDPRSPEIVRAPEREMPTEEELADPDLYLEYEARQEQKVYQSFLDASGKKVSRLREMLKQGEEQGVPEEDLEVAREKIRRIEAMQTEIKQKHPELESLPESGEEASSTEQP